MGQEVHLGGVWVCACTLLNVNLQELAEESENIASLQIMQRNYVAALGRKGQSFLMEDQGIWRMTYCLGADITSMLLGSLHGFLFCFVFSFVLNILCRFHFLARLFSIKTHL